MVSDADDALSGRVSGKSPPSKESTNVRSDGWNNDSDLPTDSESEFMMLSPE